MNRNTLLMYMKTNASTMATKIPIRINPMNWPRWWEMCAGLKGGQPDGMADDGRNSLGFFCGMRGQLLPPKFPKLHPPTCSSAARIPTSARRDHCPKRKRVKSCSRVCCRAGCTQSTAETGNGSPRTNAAKVSRWRVAASMTKRATGRELRAKQPPGRSRGSRLAARSWLLVSQRLHGIEVRGSRRGNHGAQHADEQQHQR